MSFASDTLAQAQAAYQAALTGRVVEFEGRRFEPHDIGKLRGELEYWQAQVASETALGQGRKPYGPLRFNL